MHWQRLAGRQLAVRSEAFPLDRREGVPEQRFQQFFKYAFAIRAVRHNDDAVFRPLENDRVVSKPFVMPFFEEGFTERAPIEAPTQRIAQANSFVLVAGG